MTKTITIPVPEELRTEIQRADVERSSRRDILVYLMEHPELNITQERREAYQKEYDEKYLAFEAAKAKFEKYFIQPQTNNQAINWSLNYNDCEVTITIEEK